MEEFRERELIKGGTGMLCGGKREKGIDESEGCVLRGKRLRVA